MKSPIDVVKGKIVDVDQYGVMTIKAKYDDIFMLNKRRYRDVYIQMIDSRQLSDKQRKSCYALLKEISDYTGMGTDPTKEYMKMKFLSEDMNLTADRIFSLSNAPMSLVCAFQRFLVRFILDWDIPCSHRLLDMVDDVGDYIYACLVNKKCCVCGRKADLHHVDVIGMGGDRAEMVHEGLKALPLCRQHHNEIHTIPKIEFSKKYHIPTDGIALDKTLCKIYRLKANDDNENIYNIT